MMEKYYTPTLDEFHQGFEFETKHNSYDEKWTREVFSYNENELTVINHSIDMGATRVKYLDREDIVSLGFRFEGLVPCPFTGRGDQVFVHVDECGSNTGVKCEIKLLTNRSVKIEIYSYGSWGEFHSNMEFSIKNKSELRRLLNQIGLKL